MIYMDNAATTRLSSRALEAMMPYLTEQYANPAGTYSFTNASNAAMEKARKQVADVIGAKSAEIFFTSGGTESDNWALKGVMRANEKKGRHLIISAIEHHAILHSAKALEREGFDVTVLPVDADGVVAPEAVEAAIRPDTVLVSIMAANNEIGTIEPLEAIGEVCKRHGVVFHTDAVQAFGHIPLNVEQMHIDLLSVSAHKFHGPKGVGFLYIRKGVKLLPFMDGGAQEKNRRAGTSNVAGIVGMGEAAQQAMENMDATMAKVAAVRDHLISRIEAEIPHAKLNGHRTNRLPGNVNFCFRFIEGESMLMLLDAQGVCASSGSACTAVRLTRRMCCWPSAARMRLRMVRCACRSARKRRWRMRISSSISSKRSFRVCGACPRSTRISSRRTSKRAGQRENVWGAAPNPHQKPEVSELPIQSKNYFCGSKVSKGRSKSPLVA